MSANDTMHTLVAARAVDPMTLHVTWSDGTGARLALAALLTDPAFAPLRAPAEFARVELGDWGHSLTWPSGVELGADSLWLETLSTTGHGDARSFLEWRARHGLSLSKAAEALGLSRRMVAYYSSGEKPLPKAVLLACRGWEVVEAA